MLELLNNRGDRGDDVTWAKTIFDEAVKREPEFYKDYPFEDWLNFLLGIQVIEREDDRIKITLDGREFLKYIISQGYSVMKPF